MVPMIAMDATAARPGADPWDMLADELDAWQAAGRVARLWWRDDDATRPGPRLDRLLAVRGGIPLTLAVVPASLDSALADGLCCAAGVRVAQHGYAHANHAPAGAKKSEFGPHRGGDAMLAEILAGRERLAAVFGPQFLPLFVPPWNRVDPHLAAGLAACGFAGVSAFGGRDAGTLDAHVDIVAWRGDRGFVGTSQAVADLVRELAVRRNGPATGDAAIGLLTHHKVHDERGWRFVERLGIFLHDHPAAKWVAADALLT